MIGMRVGSIGGLETGRRLPTKDRHERIVTVLHLNKSEAKRLSDLWEAARAEVPQPGPDPFTTMQSKLDEILAIVRRLDRGDRRGGGGRHSVDPTPAETPRPALRRR